MKAMSGIIDPARARRQAALRKDAARVEAEPAQPSDIAPAPLALQLREILFKIIRAAVSANGGDHRGLLTFLEAAHRDLTLALARAKQMAGRDKLPGK